MGRESKNKSVLNYQRAEAGQNLVLPFLCKFLTVNVDLFNVFDRILDEITTRTKVKLLLQYIRGRRVL